MRRSDPVTLDAYVVDTLLPDLIGHDRRPSAFLVYLVLWRHSDAGRAPAALSLRELAEATGLSKRAVQTAVDALVRRKLVALERETPTSVPSYAVLRPWARRGATS
jgi:DNA-binding MarR family transcriptional regulator